MPRSIITLLGAARGAVAIGFYNDILSESIKAGQNMDISLFYVKLLHVPHRLGYDLFAMGFSFMIFFKPEKKVIPGLREKAKQFKRPNGPLDKK